MSTRLEVESRLRDEWVDKSVADWVIHKLPLLEYSEKYKPCPILQITDEIIFEENGLDMQSILSKNKYVISGGLEGTGNHIDIVEDLWEVRALEGNRNSLIGILLEPDSYIEEHKGRKPIINLKSRAHFWSTTGLIDFVGLLPAKPEEENVHKFFRKIHNLIKPASWCASLEHPAWKEIIARDMQNGLFNITRVLVDYNGVHASFLAKTSGMQKEELIQALWDYSEEVASKLPLKHLDLPYPSVNMAPLIFDEMVKGLD